jgi:hypothetical protein
MSAIDPRIVLAIGVLAVAVYQVFVTVRLVRFHGYSPGQKVVQSIFVWLIPILGAYVVHLVIRTTEKSLPSADRDFTPQGPQSVG